jgi:hypothetical protein
MSSSSPLIFQKNTIVEKHQIEGTDPPGRSFNRVVPITRTATGYSARLQYEAVSAETPSVQAVSGALQALASQLQGLGFSRLRTRLNYRGKRYLAEKEPWVDYPDPT